LANHEWDARALLSLVLVGLPETRDRLALHKNRSLWSRIHTRLCLGEASPADTAEYVAYRMKSAGCEREVFSSDALSLLHEASHGHLRDIDRIATDCLKLAHRKRVRIIDRDIVVRVQKVEDQDAP
jgi:general secretion pathway protein A